MSDYSIGLSGLTAAKNALDIIGNNIANVATEGYHRQRVEFSPAYSSQQGSVSIGGGVDVKCITRMIDSILEQEILRQQSSLGQVSKEFSVLRTIEKGFGELSAVNSGLSTAIDEFFNSLQDLSAGTAETITQDEVITAAEIMAAQFRSLGEFLTSLDSQIRLQVENTIDGINILTNQIGELNNQIARVEISGGNSNSMKDQRDQRISELSELIGIQTLDGENGVVSVSTSGIGVPLVVGVFSNELELSFDEAANLGISIVGSSSCIANIQGGKMGGLLALKNTLVSDIRTDLDSLATALMQQINQYHVQGVGPAGSFSNLTGWANASEDLVDFSNVTDGNIYIRVTNTTTGAITRETIVVDADSDSLSDIVTDISACTGLTASVNSSNQLTIAADAGYEFDFLPAVLPEPESAPQTLAGTDPPVITVSGIYTGTTNSVFTCIVADGGAGDNKIGIEEGLKLQVEKDGVWTKDLYVGSGYSSGDKLDLGDGLYISLSIDVDNSKTAGDLVNGDNFQIKGFSNTDTSGVLAAVGVNTFFSGSSALDMAVCSDISANPRRVATALGPDMTDNTNALRMKDVRDEAISALDSLTLGGFYGQMVIDIGQEVLVREMNQDNIEVMVLNLLNQKDEISGVDINDEAAQLLVFEQMFQAMAKYISTVNSSLSSLMEIL